MASKAMKSMKVGNAFLLIGSKKRKLFRYTVGLKFADGGFPIGKFSVRTRAQVFASKEREEHIPGPIGSFNVTSVPLPPFEIVHLFLVQSNQTMTSYESGTIESLTPGGW